MGHEGESCQGKCNINMGKTGFSPGRFEKSQFGTIRKSGQIPHGPWVPGEIFSGWRKLPITWWLKYPQVVGEVGAEG